MDQNYSFRIAKLLGLLLCLRLALAPQRINNFMAFADTVGKETEA